jgi:outer membrane protein OmpA-like peptidoglycan-associated protein/tetratricopeptide (TPR) repeat protein
MLMKQHHLLTCTTILLLSFLSELNAQPIKLHLANIEFSNMRYLNAIPYYEQILEVDPDNQEVQVKLADCYRKIQDHEKALKLYGKLSYAEYPSPRSYWYYAQELAINGFHDEAIQWFKHYKDAVPDDPYVSSMIRAYSNKDSFYKDSAAYYIQYIPFINSWASDFSPTYYKNGLIFLSNRHQEEIIRTVHSHDNSSFLGYYIIADTAQLQEAMIKPSTRYVVDRSVDKHTDRNKYTSNDSNLPAQYGHIYSYDSVRYHHDDVVPIHRWSEGLRSKFHEGPAIFTRNYDTIFFTRSIPYFKSKKDEKKTSRFALFISTRKSNGWSTPVEVSLNDKSFSTGHPALNKEGNKMYFASDRPGGKGGVDIYMAYYENGKFSDPINLEDINTADDEMFPFVDANGDLYFASNGLPGLGGLDIFKATIRGEEIIDVKNLGYPFNTKMDDFGIIWNETMTSGYFSSNRKRGFSDDDIYSFKKLCRTVTAFVYDSITGEPLDSVYISTENFEGYTNDNGKIEFCLNPSEYAYVATHVAYEDKEIITTKTEVKIPLNKLVFDISGRVYSKEDNSAVADVKVILTNLDNGETTEVMTGKSGKYSFPLDIASNYTIKISKKSCGTNSIERSTVGLKKSQTLDGNIEILCKGDIIRMDNIYYDLNKYNIRPDAAVELDKLVDLMNQYPDMRIELRSHTDSRGSDKFNMKLSANRAQAVVDYLTEHGIIPSRMRASGYGESMPLNHCKNGVKCSEEEFQLNRRTEFKITSMD